MAGLGDLVNKAKDLVSGDKSNNEGILDKVKDIATDERIDQVSEQIQKITPDAMDGKVQGLADQAKKLN